MDFTSHLANFLTTGIAILEKRNLAFIASYFWERLSPGYKDIWKDMAQDTNEFLHLTGRNKMKGFWLFALKLESSLFDYDYEFFEIVWLSLLPEWQENWI